MTPAVRVSVAGWSCAAGVEADAAGSVWVLTDLDGWFGGLAVRSADVDVLGGDGSLTGPVRLAARTVVIAGTVIATSPNAVLAAMDQLDTLLTGATRTATLTVAEIARGVTRTAQVQLAGPTMCKRTGPLSADFSISLLAPDPTRHAA